MLDGTPDLPGLVTRADTKEQPQGSFSPDFELVVRAVFSCEPALGFPPTPPSGGTHRPKTKLALKLEMRYFHEQAVWRQGPLRDFHLQQFHELTSRCALLALPWLALALWHHLCPSPFSKADVAPAVTQIQARYDLPKPSKIPVPL